MYGWMDACMHAWMDGWMDKWKDVCVCVRMCAYVCVCVYVCMCVVPQCPTGIAPAHPMPLGGHRSTDCHVLGLRHHGLRPVYALRHLYNYESISMYADICVFMFLLMLIPIPIPRTYAYTYTYTIYTYICLKLYLHVCMYRIYVRIMPCHTRSVLRVCAPLHFTQTTLRPRPIHP